MRINSRSEIKKTFDKIKSLYEFPEKIEIENKGKFVILEKIGLGFAENKPQVAYMGPNAELLRITYEQNGSDINVIEVKFRDVETMNTLNSVSTKF